MPYIGKTTDGFGVRNRFIYVASADDTSVSGADANGATLTFTDGAYVDVYLNGVVLKTGTDYHTNTANTIAGLSALAANDEVTVVVYDIFTVADMVSATSGGTFSGAVTANSTLDMNGTELILDADADTSITADTDDEIHIKIAGADDFKFKANTLEVQTGSNIDMNGTELILDADGDTSITADTDDQIDFKVGGSDKMKILSGGSVGFGTTANFGGFGGSTSGLTFASAAPAYSLHETDVDKDAQFAMGGGIVYIYTADDINFKIHLNDTRRFEIMSNGDAFYFDGTSGDGDINFYNNNLYLKSSSGEVYATDSAGNHTLLSPHNFKYLPDGKSETGAWAYLSEKTAPNKVTKTIENGKERSYTKEFYDNKREDGDNFTYVNVDMMKVVREVEKLTGTKLVYSGTDGKDDGSTVKEDIIAGLVKRIETLESKVKALEEA